MDGSAPTTPSEVGKSLAAAKPVSWHGKGDVLQAPWVPTLRGKWLVIDLWSGIGGLCLALLSLGVTFWALSAECDEEAVQVAKANFPNAVHIDAVEAIDESTLQPFFQRRDVRGVLIGGGSPCQGNSELNSGRQGLLDDRSWQPTEIRRLKALVEKLAPAAEVLCLLENVASMPPEVLKQYNEWLGFPPVKVCASQCGWTHRNRFYWLGGSKGGITTAMLPPDDWSWEAGQGSGIPVLAFKGKKPIPPRVFFHQGFQPLFDPAQVVQAAGKGAMHPFTREFWHPSDRVRSVSAEAASRFFADSRRFPPSAYEEGSLLWRGPEWRAPYPDERAQMMGWPAQLVEAGNGRTRRSSAVKNSFIGNGFHIPTILAVLCFIPQLLATKLSYPLCDLEETSLSARLQGTVWEPGRLQAFPDLLDANSIATQMQSCFPDITLAPSIWTQTAERLSHCDLWSLQAFSAWRRMRGEEWQLLGPVPLGSRERTHIFAGVSGQRHPGTSSRGLDHLLPPGLGPDRHILESQDIDSPFAPREWPEPDVGFVVHAIAIWQQFLPARSHRDRQILRSVVAALKPLQSALSPHRCSASHRVAQTKNAAFVAFLTVLLRWPDTFQAQCLIKGYPIVGTIPASGVFRPIPPKADPDLTGWLGASAQQAVDEIVARGPPRFAQEIWEATESEQKKHFCGPLHSRAFMDGKYGVGGWRPLERFLHVQPCGKHRVIDNARRTLHNSNTSMQETISTVNVDYIATVFQQLFLALDIASPQDFDKYPWLDARIATDDLPDAYRGLPVCDQHQGVSVIAIWPPQGGWQFMELFGLAYGLESAVVAFNRYPQLGIAATRRCLYGLTAAYFDDELSVECVCDRDLSQRSLQFIFTAMGAPPQPAKTFRPSQNRHYLGTAVQLGEVTSSGVLRFQPKDSTRNKVLQKLATCIQTKCLSSDDAGKIRGDLNWMFSQCAGHIGKVAGPLLTRCQQKVTSTLDSADLHTLHILLAVVRDAQPRDITVLPRLRPLIRCYTDASFENGILRLGWVVFGLTETPQGGTCVVPQSEIDLWIPRRQQIFPGESLCGLVVPIHFGEAFTNCDVLWWVDNESAVAALVRGTSSQEDVHEIVQATHLTLHRLSTRVWWEWIDSSSNPSDGLSRCGLQDQWTVDQHWILSDIDFPSEASRAGFLASLDQEFSQNSG